VLETAESFWT